MGHRTITKTVTKEIEERIPTCDLCQQDITFTVKGSCPSEQPLLRIFIGNVAQYGYGGYNNVYSPTLQMFGLDLGDICRECREKWFKDLRKAFPNANEVKMND